MHYAELRQRSNSNSKENASARLNEVCACERANKSALLLLARREEELPTAARIVKGRAREIYDAETLLLLLLLQEAAAAADPTTRSDASSMEPLLQATFIDFTCAVKCDKDCGVYQT